MDIDPDEIIYLTDHIEDDTYNNLYYVTSNPKNGAAEVKVTAKELMAAEDNDSITENGLMKYTYPDNHLIQSRLIAQDIANNLLDTYSIPRKDVNVSWRGNPALELLDEIQVPEYQKGAINTQGLFYIYKQKLDYDGTLKGIIDGRKIPTTSTTTTLAP